MLLPVWSAKAGAGCTTLTLALASALVAKGDECLLVDLGGDLPAAVGIVEPTAGVSDWLAQTPGNLAALQRLERDSGRDGVDIIALGNSLDWHVDADEHLIDALRDHDRCVIVDVGDRYGSRSDSLTRLRSLVADEPGSIFVVRSGYLEVRRALRHEVRPEAMVLVRENGRGLDRYDLLRLLGTPVSAEVDYDPRIAKAIDNGTLLRRTPKTLSRQVEVLVR